MCSYVVTAYCLDFEAFLICRGGGDSLLFKVKLFIMVILMVFDVGLNSSVEHDGVGMGGDGTVLALILGFHLVVQAGIFASLFLMMFETYPFRVGLMGMLTSQYLTVYAVNVVYFLMTAFIYGYRVASVVRDEDMPVWGVWSLPSYLPLSVLHKIVATIYYVANARAALTLGDPMFYNKHAWVGLYFDRGGLGGHGDHATHTVIHDNKNNNSNSSNNNNSYHGKDEGSLAAQERRGQGRDGNVVFAALTGGNTLKEPVAGNHVASNEW